MPRRWLAALLAAGACDSGTVDTRTGTVVVPVEQDACDAALATDGLLVTSPSPGVVVRSPWIPVSVRLDATTQDADVELCLDGVPLDDPLAVTGDARNPWLGDGGDHIAYLDLRPLEPGAHEVSARLTLPDGGLLHQRSAFTYERPPRAVHIDVTDGDGVPVDARLIVLQDGIRVDLASPDAADVDPKERDAHLSSLMLPGGQGLVYLDQADTTLIVTRSLLDDVAVFDLALTDDVSLDVVLPRRVSVPDRLLADLHVHTVGSRDSFTPDRVRFQSLAAAGLDLAVITDHDRVTDTSAAAAEVLDGTSTRVWPGVEANLEVGGDSIGHLNALPLADPDAVELPPVEIETVGGTLDAYRLRQRAAPFDAVDDVVLELNHPRGIRFLPGDGTSKVHDLFNELGGDADDWIADVDPRTGTRAVDFDALEVVNRFSVELYEEVRDDWFDLLDRGVWLTGTGNSDSHALEVELAGFPVNLVGCPPPAVGEPVDTACVVGALRGGDVLVSTGPIVELWVQSGDVGAGPGGVLSGVTSATATVRVRAAPWVPVDEVRLVVDGDVVFAEDVLNAARDADGVLDLTRTWPVDVAGPGWVLAEAGWPRGEPSPDDFVAALGVYGELAPGYVPVGFTNPVFLDIE